MIINWYSIKYNPPDNDIRRDLKRSLKVKILLIYVLILVSHPNIMYSDGWKFITRPSKINDANRAILDLKCTSSDKCYAYIGNGDLYQSLNQGQTWDSIFKFDRNPYEKTFPDINNHYYLYYRDCFCGERFYTKSLQKISNDFKDVELVFNNDTSSKEVILFSLFMIDTLSGFMNSYEYVDYRSFNDFQTHHYMIFSEDGWKSYKRREIPLNFWNSYFFHKVDDENILASSTGPFTLIKGTDTIRRGGMITNYNYKKDEWTILHKFPMHDIDYEGPYTYAPQNIQMVNDSVGYGIHARMFSFNSNDDGKNFDVIFRTRDGGRNWEKVLDTLRESNSWDIQEIKFYDERNGIIVGRFGKILMTNDGGDTWLLENTDEFKSLKSTFVMHVDWAGQFPIVGTSLDGNLYRYEGDFFKFDFKSPDLFYPKNNTVGTENNIKFRWEELRDATSYGYQLSVDSEFSNIIRDFSGKKMDFQFSGLAPFTEYWWRVSSTNGTETLWSAPAKFRTKMPFISTSSPDCGAMEQEFNVNCSWASVKGAEYYRIIISIDPAFADNNIEYEGITGTSFEVSDLEELTMYYWKVQPYRTDETGGWSNVCNFKTKKSTSVRYSEERGIWIKPNPTTDFITITLSNKGFQPFATTDKVQIFDVLGIEIKDLTPALSKGEGVRIDVSHLPKGVYFIRIGDKVEKFVKM